MASFVLSFFPLDVLDEIRDVLSQFLRDFLSTLRCLVRDTEMRTSCVLSFFQIFYATSQYTTCK